MKGDVCQSRNIDDMSETDDYFRRTYQRMSENRTMTNGTSEYTKPMFKIWSSSDLEPDSISHIGGQLLLSIKWPNSKGKCPPNDV